MRNHTCLRIPAGGLSLALFLLASPKAATAANTLAARASASPGAAGVDKPCPTCPQAIGLDSFRGSVSSEIPPVIIELQEPSGVIRRMAEEKSGRAMTVRDLMGHGATLQGRQKSFIASLRGRGVRALLRETDTRQIDG